VGFADAFKSIPERILNLMFGTPEKRAERLRLRLIVTELAVVKKTIKKNNVYLFTLHTNPDAVIAGGTEAHVRQLRALLLNQQDAVLVMTPAGEKGFLLVGWIGKNIFFEKFFQEGECRNLMLVLEHYVDRLHVHHTVHWPRDVLALLANSSIKIKTVSAHDLFFLCPSVILLTDYEPQRFCAVESDMKKCNECLTIKYQHKNETMQAYRFTLYKFLEKFDTVLVPSFSVLPYFEKAYGVNWSGIASKVKVLPHDINYIFNAKKVPHPEKTKRARICFIGEMLEHKGYRLLRDAIPELQREGFDIEVCGSIQEPHPNFNNVKISSYKTTEELAILLSEHGGPDFICYPSIVAETFCYTFFEGLLLSQKAIPIVGPYGNPASVCKDMGIGPVMSACTSAALVDAVMQAKICCNQYREKIDRYSAVLREKTEHNLYLSEYIKATSSVGAVEKECKRGMRGQFAAFFLALTARSDGIFGDICWKVTRVLYRIS
jgi:glycosyltransferase involved in cell wall biosynthesis